MDKKMMDFLTRLSRGLAAQFGENCEIVVHDIKPGDETISSISLIENGHVTGRNVGDGPSQAVIDALTEGGAVEDRLSYFTKTDDGKILRSTTIYIKNDEGRVEGVFSINFDITYLALAENAIRSFTGTVDSKNSAPKITSDVESLLDDLIEQSVRLVGKPVALMTKDDKIKAIRFLNDTGAFLITRSGDKVASYFNISKFTLYNYIDMGKKMTGGIKNGL
ncbi:MAG TPA: helix-turn-helix transcriptional regulator [Firmicutes bacterium]|nr:helix-turn-helix transcriptional regulator [Bacillota bacterium]